MLNNKDVRERLTTFREEYPISLAAISRKIGLTSDKRYVLCRFVSGKCNLYDETLKSLNDYLTAKGY